MAARKRAKQNKTNDKKTKTMYGIITNNSKEQLPL
jgi:hypothetical protein